MNRIGKLRMSGFVVVTCICLLLVSNSHAQITNATNDTSTPIEGAGHDYIKMLSETVNPANGSVSLRIQIPLPKGRGITIPFSLAYDSNSVHHLVPGTYPNYGTVNWGSNTAYLAQGGWNYAIPQLTLSYWAQNVAVLTGYNQGPIYTVYQCYYATSYFFRDASNGGHALGVGATWPGTNPQACTGTSVAGGGDGQVNAILTSPRAGQSGQYNENVAVYDRGGTVYTFPAAGGPYGTAPATTYAALPTSIEDRNGNVATITSNGSGFSLTDTTGRTISASGFGPSGTTNTISAGGLSYQATWKTVTASFSTSTPIWAGAAGQPNGTSDTCYPIPAAHDSQTVISTIALPNGKNYTFYYGTDAAPHSTTNPYGLLSEIDYPSGGWVTYTWKLSDTPNEIADYPGVYNAGATTCSNDPSAVCPAPVQDGCLYQYETPVVATRAVGFGESSTPSLTQAFQYSTAWGSPAYTWTSKTTQVTTTDDVVGRSSLTTYAYTPVLGQSQPFIYTMRPQIAVESAVQYYDWGNTSTPLRTDIKSWYDQFNLASDTTEVPTQSSTLMSESVYCYAGSNCTPAGLSQLMSTSEYGFGQGAVGPLMRKTVTTYQGFSGNVGIIADAPCKTVVNDGGGSRYAETDYLYDGGSSLCGTVTSAAATTAVSVVSGTHDESLFGPSKATPRGNVTQKTQWASTGTSPVTTYTYDETGQVLTMTDPCGNATCSDMNLAAGPGHATTYYYADSYTNGSSTCTSANGPNGNTNSLLTKIVYPATSGVAHSECFSYDYNSGQLTGRKDQNSQLTTYAYSDPFYRPTLVKYPDGGQTTLAYNDTAPSPSITTTKLISGSVNLVNTTVMDGMRHVVQTQTTDPDGLDYVDTSYDGLGRVLSFSNPHRSSALPTDGTTVNTLDALGRTTRVQRPDGSTVQSVYQQACSASPSGLGTMTTDEAGKLRRSCSDAFGRLIEVDEPGAGAGTGSPGTATVSINENAGQVSNTFQICYYQNNQYVCQNQTVYNSGYIYLTVNGVQYSTAYGPPPPQGPYSTASIASALASQINGAVTAVANGSNIALTATTTGANTNYSLSTSATYNSSTLCPSSPCFSGPSFYASAPSSLTGGSDPGVGSNPLVTQYTYDPLNNLTCGAQKGTDTTAFSTCASASATWRPRSFAYDSLSRLTSAINPESGTVLYVYDVNGNLNTKSAPAPNQFSNATVTTSNHYDALNRLVAKTYSDGTTANVYYSYDVPPSWMTDLTNVVGRVASSNNQYAGTAGKGTANTYSYDAIGRVLRQWQQTPSIAPGGKYVYSTFDLAGNLTSTTTAAGTKISYGPYDTASRLTVVTSSLNDAQHPGTLYSIDPTIGYYPNGSIRKASFGNGLTQTLAFNNRLQPCRINVNSGSGYFSTCTDAVPSGNVLDFTFGYNAGSSDNGNVVTWSAVGNQTFSRSYVHDALNRIQSMSDSATGQSCKGLSFTIDAWGNLTGQTNTGGTCYSFQAAVGTNNQLQTGYQYDSAGNMYYDLSHHYAYDAENRIIQVDSGSTASYVYNENGKRVRKNVGSGWTDYFYGPNGSIQSEYNGSFPAEYVYAGSNLIAEYTNSTTGFVHTDYLGSTRVLTGVSRAVLDSLDYTPFGQTTTGGTWTTHKFTGKERDFESGLDYFGARHNASALGRFITPDPSNVSVDFWLPQTWNRYSYALNNPLKIVDRNGLWPTSIHNEIINQAFPGLAAQDRVELIQASYDTDYFNQVDGHSPQDPEVSFVHGMSDGIHNEDPMQAQQEGDSFIAQNEHNAQDIQAEWEAEGNTGIAPAALTAFGNALHTVTDRTSPTHSGNQPWYGVKGHKYRALRHVLGERNITAVQMQTAVAAARQAFRHTFGDQFEWLAIQRRGTACVTTPGLNGGPPDTVCQ